MNADHRRLLVVAIGAVCWAVARALIDLINQTADGGWFNYAPANEVVITTSPTRPLRELLVWLAAIAVWYVISKRVLNKTEDT